MGEIIVVCNVTLDGVMQAPGLPDEDLRGDFPYGGWAAPYSKDAMGRVLGQRAGKTGGMLLGRRTYEQFASFWPKQPDNPYTEALNRQQKYVVSSTLRDPDWVNSHVITLDDIPKLKAEQDLVVLGSGELLRSIPHLFDRYILLIHPLVLGTGRRLFESHHQPLELTHTEETTTGVVITTYRPATREG
ncbi:dihydrofolate reductase [Kribbella antiqua]|uniref:Dihydrofolate reductase n=1 Tax=Kribbella antiqua TaxID=2512217 RepID=A0A4R2INV8_9ACTN|nr:dihydrofolate reductase family protein [Kribbella antiqua]TCO46824.1 dihydrofolate reductase [Kribbella antiqua]